MKDIKINAIDVEVLIELYERHNFLYSAKKEKLLPFLPLIKENLKKAFTLPDSLYRTLTAYNEYDNQFSSIAAWRYADSSIIIQHLVSNHPVKTREIFLFHILKLAGLCSKEGIQAILTYYQPKTRFAHKMFTHLYENRVSNGVVIEPFHYYQYNFGTSSVPDDKVVVELLQPQDYDAFQHFILQERGSLYLNTLDLKPGGFTLQDLNECYQQAGLFRSRKVLVAKERNTQTICGALIINTGSIGLHFSLIENSSEIIIDSWEDSTFSALVSARLLHEAQYYYKDCPLGYMPLLVKFSQAEMIENLGAIFQRQYNMMICDTSNFMNWITYLLQEYEKSLHYTVDASNKLNMVS